MIIFANQMDYNNNIDVSSNRHNRRFDGSYEFRYDVNALLSVFEVVLNDTDDFGADDDAICAGFGDLCGVFRGTDAEADTYLDIGFLFDSADKAFNRSR